MGKGSSVLDQKDANSLEPDKMEVATEEPKFRNPPVVYSKICERERGRGRFS